ncbi:MAG TPA: chloride channel protein [Pirellulales bacterium]|jgi:CIC family chloride channel protein|nr:chloride channel protein [Pirellulales bacterium]
MEESTGQSPRSHNPLVWFPEFLRLGRRRLPAQIRLMGSAILIGVVAGVGAIGFYWISRLIEHYALGVLVGYQPAVRPTGEIEFNWLPAAAQAFHPWMLLVVPTIGGLVSGFLVYTFAPEAEGHGTDAVIAAYHNKQGQIRPRVPLIKIISSAVTIGTGGSGGREGPIAQIGAGFGSLLANLLRMRPAERRVLMAAGMGAGIAAIFRAPLAGALFAAEVLYWSPEFEPEVIIPAGLASVVSYCTFGIYSGWKTLFAIPALDFDNPWQLGAYSLLALGMILLAALYTRSFYGFTHLFHRWRIPPHFKPAIGAMLTGVIGLALYFAFGKNQSVLAVLSFGYGSIQEALTDSRLVSAGILAAIAFGKILTTGLTIGSGGSGGVFGPSVVIGGCGGGALGILFSHWWPGLQINPASFVVVGMAGFFAAAAKTPFSTIVIVSEMTGGYLLLLPTLWVCMLAFILSDEKSLYSAQVESRSRSPAHQGSYLRDLLSGVKVGQFLKGLAAPMLRPEDSLGSIIGKLNDLTFSVLPVVDSSQRLAGVVNLEEVYFASRIGSLQSAILAEDLMRTDVTPLQPDDDLEHAQEMFIENDLLALPVVNNLVERQLIGMIRRFDISSAYLRRLQGTTAEARKA